MNESVLRDSALWDEHWARFSNGLLDRGVVSGKHTFYQAWVRKFLSVLRPKTIFPAENADVETFLKDLLKEGKMGWQVEQARRALELFCREVTPLDWAQGPWLHTLRHSFATHLLEGCLSADCLPASPPLDCTVQELLGYSDVSTTVICCRARSRESCPDGSPCGRATERLPSPPGCRVLDRPGNLAGTPLDWLEG